MASIVPVSPSVSVHLDPDCYRQILSVTQLENGTSVIVALSTNDDAIKVCGWHSSITARHLRPVLVMQVSSMLDGKYLGAMAVRVRILSDAEVHVSSDAEPTSYRAHGARRRQSARVCE